MFQNIKNFKEGDWNEIDITVTGGIISNTFNGKALTAKDTLEVRVTDGKPVARLNGQMIEVSSLQCSVSAEAVGKCNGEMIGKPMPMRIPGTGPIGLESEIGRFEFRRIRIKELR